MSELTLVMGNMNYSSWSIRPWLALKQAGAQFRTLIIKLDEADTKREIDAHSPSGRVPALLDGELTVWDSLAICEYVNERFPAAQLWPAEPAQRAVARSVACEMHSGFAALRNACTMDVRARRPYTDSPEVQADVARIRALWRDCRAKAPAGGPFLFGAFSIADAMFAPVVSRFRTYDLPLDGADAEYADSIWALPAVKEWEQLAHDEPWTVARYAIPGK